MTYSALTNQNRSFQARKSAKVPFSTSAFVQNNIFVILSIFLVSVMILGHIITTPSKIEAMTQNCATSYAINGKDPIVWDIKSQMACSASIQAVQADGHHEVLTDGNGKYWAEEK